MFLICYKISDPISLYNVKNKWIGDVRRHRPDAPVVLCGCMSDLRADQATAAALAKVGRAAVSREQGLAICCEIGAVNFVEASAATDHKDVQEAFEVCAVAAISKQANFVSSPVNPIKSPLESKISKRNGSSGGGHRNAVNEFFSPRSHPSNKSLVSSTSLITDNSNTASSKKSFGSASTHSSLGKKIGNISFSGSDSESVCFESTASTTPAQYNLSSKVILEDDIFPNGLQPRSPRSEDASNERQKVVRQQLRSSFVGTPPIRNETSSTSSPRPRDRLELGAENDVDVETSVDTLDKQFPDFRRPTRLSSASVVSPNSNRKSVIIDPTASPLTSPTMAQVRPSGLSRRTSFRSQSGNTPKAVATPKSPLADCPAIETCQAEDSLSPLAVSTRKPLPKSQILVTSSPNNLAAFDMKQTAGESLKSLGSTASHGSTGSAGSKTSTGSSLISTDSAGRQVSRDILDPDVPDTEDPELLRQLQFVSPKTGVFRPVNAPASAGKNGRKKPNCRMM